MFKYPYTNLHELNLDWILNQIKEIDSRVKAINIGNALTENHVEYYGAKGDLVTDDSDAIQRCADYCSTNGTTMIFNGGGKYRIEREIVFDCSIDFNGAVIVPSGDGFAFRCSRMEENFTVSPAAITADGTTDSRLFNKTAVLKSDTSLGRRYGTGEEYFLKQVVSFDGAGKYVSTPWRYPSPTSFETEYVCSNYIPFIVIKNARFYPNNGTKKFSAMFIARDNVILDNINFGGVCAPEGNGFNLIGKNIIISNCSGVNPNSGNNVWGYVFTLATCDNVLVKNCSFKRGGWPCFSGSYTGNVRFDNVTGEDRFDIHYQSWGENIIENSYLDKANLAGGIVNYTIKNSRVYVTQRDDLKIPIAGIIRYVDCANIYSQLRNDSESAYHVWQPGKCVVKYENCVFKTSAILGSTGSAGDFPVELVFTGCQVEMSSQYTPPVSILPIAPNLKWFITNNVFKYLMVNDSVPNAIITGNIITDTMRIRNTTRTIINDNIINGTMYIETGHAGIIITNNIVANMSGTANIVDGEILDNNLTSVG